MTGRELIIYILENDLEDEPIVKNGVFVGLMSEDEVAANFEVGRATIKAWLDLGTIEGIEIGKSIFFLKNTTNPIATRKMEEVDCEQRS